MAENNGWRTIQVAPAAPGLFVDAYPVVAFLLQEYVNNPKETRVVAAYPDGGYGELQTWEKGNEFIKWAGAWKRPDELRS